MTISYLGLRSLIYPAPHKSMVVLMGPMDVGGGVILSDIESPTGEVFGVIFNPHFKA